MKLSDKENSVDVIYVDNHLLVLNKPAGLLTQPTNISLDSLETRAKAWVKRKYKKPGRVFLECIHRLDKPVSGIVVFARTSKALSRMQKQMREKTIAKYYLALVEGTFLKEKGEMTHTIAHSTLKAKLSASGKQAFLEYKVKRTYENLSLVEIRLHTGRYHQIRVQMSLSKHPVVGDKKYKSRWMLDEGIALHHAKIELEHPVTKEKMLFTSNAPFEVSIEQYLFQTNAQKK
jgi:23S rRNA pseudouridine1911/1915/1917 synthase